MSGSHHRIARLEGQRQALEAARELAEDAAEAGLPLGLYRRLATRFDYYVRRHVAAGLDIATAATAAAEDFDRLGDLQPAAMRAEDPELDRLFDEMAALAAQDEGGD